MFSVTSRLIRTLTVLLATLQRKSPFLVAAVVAVVEVVVVVVTEAVVVVAAVVIQANATILAPKNPIVV